MSWDEIEVGFEEISRGLHESLEQEKSFHFLMEETWELHWLMPKKLINFERSVKKLRSVRMSTLNWEHSKNIKKKKG